MKKLLLLFGFLVAFNSLKAQTFTPVAVSGFNHDGIAETFPDATTCTDTMMDATNHIMFSTTFGSAAGISGGLPPSGLITDPSNTRQFQLQPYNSNNTLFVFKNQTKALTLNTPASYQKLTLLAFSTETASHINVYVQFTDGTTSTYLSNYNLPDWFNGTTNQVLTGFGRIKRVTTAPYSLDGYPTNPMFYYVDINLTCADQPKQVQAITVKNVSTTGSTPWPCTMLMAVSGLAYQQTITPTLTGASCSAANGSASLNIAGNTGPYSVSWNTTPVQTGTAANNLSAGNYTASITDAQSCTTTFPVTITNTGASVAVTATATPATICNGNTSQLSATGTGGTINSYNWSPGGATTATVTVSPFATTTYTVTGTDQYGCNYNKQVTVTVNDTVPAPVVTVPAVCSGHADTLTITNPGAGATYNWYATPSGGSILYTGTAFPTGVLSSNTVFYIEPISAANCTNHIRFAVNVTVNTTPNTPVVTSNSPVCQGTTLNLLITSGTVAGGSYSWTGPNSFTSSQQTPSITNVQVAAAGNYNLVVTSNGCSSAAGSTPVVVNPTASIAATGSNPTACSSATGSITITGAAPNTTYSVSYSFNGGAATVVSLTSDGSGNIVISSLVAGTYSNIVITANGCPSNSVGPVVLIDPGPPGAPSANSNAPVCSGNTLTLTAVGAAGATYNWTGPNGFTSNQQNPSITNATQAATGTYFVTATLAGCTGAQGSTAVVVNQTPAAPLTSSNSPVCSGTTLNLNTPALAGGTYSWTGPNGFTSTQQNPSIANVTLAAAGSYSLIVTQTGCTSLAGSTTVVVDSTPVITAISNNPTICTSSTGSITINGLTPGTSYSVSYKRNGAAPVVNNYSSDAGGSIVISGLDAATYSNLFVTLTGCPSNTWPSIVLTDPTPPPAPFANALPNPVCEGDSISFTATSSYPNPTFNWTGPNGFTSNLQNPVIANPTIAANGTYLVTVTSNSCTSAPRLVSVTIHPRPGTPTINDDQICPNQNSVLHIQNTQAATTYNWFLASTGGVAVHTGTTYTTPLQPATISYYVEASNIFGCVSTSRGTSVVTVLPVLAKPVVTVTDLTSNSVTFSWAPIPGATSYGVSLDGGLNFVTPSSGPTGLTQTVINLHPGDIVTIQVQAMGTLVCQTSTPSDEVSVTIPDKRLFVPNVFTPNGDGKNDMLMVYSTGLKDMNFLIYNQWGQVVFQSSDPSKGWDGTFKGVPQPVGVYFYVLKAVMADSSSNIKKGSINLIR